MASQIRKLGAFLIAAFLVLFLQLNYVHIFAAPEIASHRANRRALLREYSIRRGRIITLDGVVVADAKATGGKLKFQRTYPKGKLYGHITGFHSVLFGRSRIESTHNNELLGEGGVISIQDIEDRVFGADGRGDDVRLTIHSRLQELARDALGNQNGAVVALDPASGEVRAMYANPSYDPSGLAEHDAKAERSFWRSLNPDSPTSPLVPKATSRAYPPGSTFKVVTAAAALQAGRGPDSTFPDPVALDLPQTTRTLHNFTRTTCAGGGHIDLFTALEVSCDTTFASLGLDMHDKIHRVAERLGFNEPIPSDVGTAPSAFPAIGDDRQPLRAFAAIGQADVTATPLQMALVAAAVANDGEVMRPRLVREVLDRSAGVVRRSPQALNQAMSPEVARALARMMVAVVESGTGTAAQIPGLTVAGKTGTAQTAEGKAPHAWFISFAPAEDPQLAVAVIVEHGGSLGSEATGGAVAAPIARAIFQADREIRGW